MREKSICLRSAAIHLSKNPSGHNVALFIDYLFTLIKQFAENMSFGVTLRNKYIK